MYFLLSLASSFSLSNYHIITLPSRDKTTDSTPFPCSPVLNSSLHKLLNVSSSKPAVSDNCIRPLFVLYQTSQIKLVSLRTESWYPNPHILFSEKRIFWKRTITQGIFKVYQAWNKLTIIGLVVCLYWRWEPTRILGNLGFCNESRRNERLMVRMKLFITTYSIKMACIWLQRKSTTSTTKNLILVDM